MQYSATNSKSLFTAAAMAVAVTAAAIAAHRLPAAKAGLETAMLQRLAEEGNAGAQLQLGLAYRDGRNGLAADSASAAGWLEAAARGGNAYAATALADAYAAEPQRAQQWWLAGARGGNAEAQARLGHVLLAQGRDEQGIDWLRAAADRGDAQARAELARLYRDRSLPDADLHRGENPLAVVAERTGDNVLRAGLGVWHLVKEVANTEPTTRSLARRAAAGDPAAEYQLALRYRDGVWGTQRDPQQAQAWLRRAAADGNDLAAQALATPPGSHPGADAARDAADEPLAATMPHLTHS